MATHKSSLADKQAALVKILKNLKKAFGTIPKPMHLPVFETLLFGICLEDVDFERAKKAFDKLRNSFLDWNEVRVTTVTELDQILDHLPNSAMRAVRMRQLLMHIYDHQYTFDFEALKKRTQELVHRQLARIKHLTPFARNYATQTSLGAHVIPVDRRMLLSAIWLGLVPVGVDEEEAADLLKGMVRKADGAEFFFLLKSFSTCSKAGRQITEDSILKSPEGFDVSTAANRMLDLLPIERPTTEKSTHAETVKPATAAIKPKPAAVVDTKPAKKASGKSSAESETPVAKKRPKEDVKTAVVKKRSH